MNPRHLTISTLSITAVILLVAVVLVNVMVPSQAVASGQGGQAASQYVVTTGRLDPERELLYIFNTQANITLVYGFNTNVGALELIQSIDMRPLLQMQFPPEGEPAERRRPR